MKKLLTISLALILLSFAACKKSNTDQPVPAIVIPKVKTVTISNGATILNTGAIEYDNAGRRTKVIYMDGSKVDFIFSGNTMTQEQFNSAGVSQNKYTYSLNAEGLTDSYFANATPTVITFETYNAAQKLLSDITKNNGATTYQKYYMYDNLGNLSADSTLTTNGITLRTYEYYTDKISTIENINSGVNYSGTGNKNCQKKVTAKSPSNVITTYDYSVPEIDAQGRVTKQSYTVGSTTTTNAFTYY